MKYSTILSRIQYYLESGGLFDPDLMDHQAVSVLIQDCRDYIKEQHEINERCNRTINELRLVNAFESVMENKMAEVKSVKCKNSEPYVERTIAKVGLDWYIYNKTSGYIIASTYCRPMAEIILEGIRQNKTLRDEYGICEQYRGPVNE